MKEKIHIVIRLDESPIVSDYYKASYRTKTYGAQRAAEIYPVLREHALASIKGVFTFDEIKLLMSILKSRIDRFEISKEILIKKIEEITKIQPSLKDGKADEIISKIEQFDFYQSVVFSEWISTYLSYTESGRIKTKVSLKKYAENLLS